MISDPAIATLFDGLAAELPRRGRLVSVEGSWQSDFNPWEREFTTEVDGLFLSQEMTTEAAFDYDAGWLMTIVTRKKMFEDTVLETRFFPSDQALFQRRWSQPSAAETRHYAAMPAFIREGRTPVEEVLFDERWVARTLEEDDALEAGLLIGNRFKPESLRALAQDPRTSLSMVAAGSSSILEIRGPLKAWRETFAMDRPPFGGNTPFLARLEFGPDGRWLTSIELRVEQEYEDEYEHNDWRTTILTRYYGAEAQVMDCARPDARQCYPPLVPIETAVEVADVSEVTQELGVQIEGQSTTLLLEWTQTPDESRVRPAAPIYLSTGDELYVAGFWSELSSGLKFLAVSIRLNGVILNQDVFHDEELDAEGLSELAEVREKTIVRSVECDRRLIYTLCDTFGRRWRYEGAENVRTPVLGDKVIIRPTWIDGRLSFKNVTNEAGESYWLNLLDGPK